MALTLPVISIENGADYQISASIDISAVLSISSQMQQGLDGDIFASIPVVVEVSGLLQHTIIADSNIDVSDVISMATDMIYSDTYTTVDVDADIYSADFIVSFRRGAFGNLSLENITLSGQASNTRMLTSENGIELDLTLAGSARAGYITSTGRLDIPLEISGSARASIVGSGKLDLNPILFGRGASAAIASGSLELDLEITTTNTNAYLAPIGSGSLTLDIKLSGTGFFDVYFCLVMNTFNFALTEYDYELNSLVYFNGAYLGASATSLYELTGSDDDGEVIDWYFRTGKVDMHKNIKNRLVHAWLSYQPSGDLLLTVNDGNDEYEYTINAIDVIDETVRVKTGKGLKAKYLDFKISNNGTYDSIFLDRLRLFIEPLKTKRR